MKPVLKRIITAVILAGLLFLVIWLHGWYIVGVFVAISLGIQYEMIKTIKKSGTKPVSAVLYVFTALLMPIYYFYGLAAVFILQMFAVVLIFVAGIVFKTYNYESIFSSIFCLYYPQLFFVFLYIILFLKTPSGVIDVSLSRLILLVAFSCACGTDIFAYVFGSIWGKTPLCPHISPKKTVEGALGGLVGGIVFVQISG